MSAVSCVLQGAGCSTAGCATCHMPLLDSQLAIMEAFPNAKRMLRRLLWRECVYARVAGCACCMPQGQDSLGWGWVCLSFAAWSAACGPRSVEARVVFQLSKLPHAACGVPLEVASCHFLLPLPLLALKLNCFHLPAKKDDNWRSLTSAQHTHTHIQRQRLRLLLRAAFVGRATRGFCWLRRSSTRSARRDLCPCSPLAHPLAVQQSQPLSISLPLSLSLSGLSIAAIAVGVGWFNTSVAQSSFPPADSCSTWWHFWPTAAAAS